MKTVFASLVIASVFILVGNRLCFAQGGETKQLEVSPEPSRIGAKHLPNAIQVHSKVVSGGQPDGEQAFRELKELGFKTIVSVDGAKPEVELAKKYGLRYVHLPHGYDGIASERAAELAKAVRDFDGPIYIHCHHGKHRSPTAAVVACVTAGFIEPKSALGILKLAGTNENYRGLFAAAAAARRIDGAKLDTMHVEFPEIAKLPPMAEAMVALDLTHDHLKQFAEAGWSQLPKHPDLDPAHESLLLREHFTEILRLDDVAMRPEGFRKILQESEADATSLEAAIRQWNRSAKLAPAPKSLAEAFNRIDANCTACHRQYRE